MIYLTVRTKRTQDGGKENINVGINSGEKK